MSHLAFFLSVMKKSILFFLFFASIQSVLYSQDFRGIEFRLGFNPIDSFGDKHLTINVYYKSIDTVKIDTFRKIHCFGWQSFPKTNHYFFSDNIQLLQYEGDVYISLGFNDCVTDTFFLEGVKNYNNGKLTPIQFSTSFFTLSSYDEDAKFNSKLNDSYFDNGIFHFDASAYDPNGENVAYYLLDNFDFGEFEQYYSVPVGTDTLRMDTVSGKMTWNRPNMPGKYLVYFGYSTSFTPVPSWYSVEMKRYMIIEVKPEDIVSTTEYQTLKSAINIYPNPTRGSLYLSIKSFDCGSEGKLTIYNALGQGLIFEPVYNPQNIINKEIDISKLPPGVYLLSYETCGQIETKKVVIN